MNRAGPARINLKRAYEAPDDEDGHRVLVDRMWPRGLSKDELSLDDWIKDVAPSPDLRKWFGHDPNKWERFKERYFAELDDNREPVRRLLDLPQNGPLTLVFAAKDERHNNAVALKEYLERKECD